MSDRLTTLCEWRDTVLRQLDEAAALGFSSCEITVPTDHMVDLIMHFGNINYEGFRVTSATTIELEWDEE